MRYWALDKKRDWNIKCPKVSHALVSHFIHKYFITLYFESSRSISDMLGSHSILFLTNLGEKSDQFMALKYREESGVPDVLTLMNFNLDFDRDCRSYSEFKYFPIFFGLLRYGCRQSHLKCWNIWMHCRFMSTQNCEEKWRNTNKTLAIIIRKSVIYRIFI